MDHHLRRLWSLLFVVAVAVSSCAQSGGPPLAAGTSFRVRSNPAFTGPPNNLICLVNGGTNSTLKSCNDFFTNLGVKGGTIYDNVLEDLTVNPFNPALALRVTFGFGLNGTVCNTSTLNCLVTEVPLILGNGTDLFGASRVAVGGNLSTGTAITAGSSFPAALNQPTNGTSTASYVASIVCSNSGGSLATGFYNFVVEYVNNLQTYPSANATLGYSQPTTEAQCNITGPSGSITFPMPSAAGSGSFAATDVAILVSPANASSTTTGGEVLQKQGTAGITCTAGTFLLNAANVYCSRAGASAVVTAIQTPSSGSANHAPVLADLSNPMIVLGNGNLNANDFSTEMKDITLLCPPSGNEPNVLLWNGESEEGSGTYGVVYNGPCGGYTGTTGGYAYFGPDAPNSHLINSQTGQGPTTGTNWRSVILDGQASFLGAAGTARLLLDNSWTQHSNGETGDAVILIAGSQAHPTIVGNHLEAMDGVHDCIQVTNSAAVSVFGGDCSTGIGVHYTATAANPILASSVRGFQNSPASNNAIEDDVNGVTVKGTGIVDYPIANGFPLPNVTPATVNGSTAKLSGAPSKVTNGATGTGPGFVGVTLTGGGSTSGQTASVTQEVGIAPCTYDNATTAGDYVQNSGSTNGNCHDVGVNRPTTGQIIGRVLATNGSAGSNPTLLFPPETMGVPVQSVITGTYTNAGTTAFTTVAGAAGFGINASQNALLHCVFEYQGSATTAVPSFQITGPASPTAVRFSEFAILTSGGSPTFFSQVASGFSTPLTPAAIVTTATDMLVYLDVDIINGTTAGTIQVQARPNGAGTLTIETAGGCAMQ